MVLAVSHLSNFTPYQIKAYIGLKVRSSKFEVVLKVAISAQLAALGESALVWSQPHSSSKGLDRPARLLQIEREGVLFGECRINKNGDI